MKEETKKIIIRLSIGTGIFFLLVWAIFFRLPFNYTALPISGKVVDADTGEPLENAIVIAIWELERGFGLEGTIASGFMNVTEVVTDQDGNYFIEGWGPLRRPSGTYLGHYAPRLIVFKEGYKHFAYGNLYESIFKDNRRKKLHRSSWDGEMIKLQKFDGDLYAFSNVLKSVSSNLDTIFNPIFGAKKCDWLDIPRMVATFNTYDLMLRENDKSAILIPDLINLNWENQCGSDDYIQSLLRNI